MESKWKTDLRIPEIIICRWSLEILKSLRACPKRFSDLLEQLGISNKILSDRLQKLASHSLISKSREGYILTSKGLWIVENFSILFDNDLSPIVIESVLRCKWMRSILGVLHDGELYASEIIQRIPGIRWRVLSTRLKRLKDYGLIDREVIPSHPIRVKYGLTRRGRILAGWILINGKILPVRL